MPRDDATDELIREIAARHGVAVGRDDPILILQTLYDKLQRDSLAAQQQALTNFQSELEIIAHRWQEGAKDNANRSLAAALADARQALADAMEVATISAMEAVRREFATASAKISAHAIEARRVAWLNMAAAALTLTATAFALWMLR